jgi:NitT/TauT family transport system ATP-binding protein
MAATAASDTPHLSVESLRKVYLSRRGSVEALQSVSLRAAHGEFVSLLGPSGCGKSTLLLIVAGLAAPTTGRVTLSGTDVQGPRAETGIVFQTPVLLPWRSVLDNVLYPIQLRRRPVKEYLGKADRLLEMVGLSQFKHHLPGELSGGMQQRVAICRALIHEPNLLLMDEPFSALDAMTRDFMNQELLRIWQEFRKTVLFVTHSIREAIFLSDRVLVMSRRPATIIKEIPIRLERPRVLDVQESEAFNRYAGELRRAIEDSHAYDPV